MTQNQITRKDFLIHSGMLLTVPLFLKYCASADHSRLTGKTGFDPLQNSESENYSDPILKAINTGITAPNPHNTQSWKFKILNSTEMFLYVDEKRILPQTDPPTRQIHIGTGCFLEHLKIGAKQIGYDTEMKILPEGDYKIEETGIKSVAHIKLIKSPIAGNILYNSIQYRTTNRTVYTGDLITKDEVNRLKDLGKSENSSVNFIISETEMKPYKELFLNAMKVETLTFRTNEESRIWFRFNDKEIYSYRDGVSLPGNGISGFKRWMVENFFIGREPKIFHNKNGLDSFLSGFKKVCDSSKGFVFFKTSSNTKKDWILAGMDYARFQLAVTHSGLQMSPLSQVLQEFPEMEKIKKQFEDLTGTKSPEKIQMIARLGRSDYRFYAPRRNMKDMIIK